MNVQEICRPRKIRIVNFDTPLLVPSLSSKGFPKIKEIHGKINEHLVDASLVSAYDLHYNFLLEEDIYYSDVLFIDSGGFESTKDIELSEVYNDEYIPKEWSSDLHNELISKLQPLSPLVITSYDIRTSIDDQVEKAQSFFEYHSKFAGNFLYKPPIDTFVQIDDYTRAVSKLTRFSVLGFTEKELGHSIKKRCENIFKIRRALIENHIDTPIHIFGCIDPLTIIVYFLSGADVFDGLSWLRFAFEDQAAIYINSHSLTLGNWSLEDNRNRALTNANNLSVLTKLMGKMRQFTKTHDLSVFELNSHHEVKVRSLVSEIGISL